MNSNLLAVSNVLSNSVGDSISSSKCKTPKNKTPFTLHSTDNPHVNDNTHKTTTYNITTGDTNKNSDIKKLTINKDSKTTNQQKVYENINKEKSKTNNSAVGVSLSVNPLHVAPNKKLSNTNLISDSKVTITANGSRQQQTPEKTKTLTQTAQLTNNASKTTPKPALTHVVDGLSLTDKTILQKGDYSHIKPQFAADKVSVAQLQKDNITPTKPFKENSLSSRNEKADNSQKIVANGKEKQTDTNTMTGSTAKKTPLFDLGLSTVQKKPIEAEQKTPAITVKSTTVTEKPIVSEPSAKVDNNYVIDVKTLEKSLIGHKKEPLGNRANNISTQKPNIPELQVSISQTKIHPSSASDKSPNSDLVRILPIDNANSSAIEQPQTLIQVLNNANQQGQISQNDISTNISQQVTESIRASLQQVDLPRQITVRLEPPDLGNILVRFQEQEDRIIGLLEFSKPEIKYEMEQALPQIIRTLADCGIQIKQLEVQLADKFESYSDRALTGDSLENSLLQYQNSAKRGDSNGNGEEWLTNGPNNNYHNYYDDSEPQLIATNESINMLI
jgi:hypothetical protein